MAYTLETDPITTQNLTTRNEVGSYTATKDGVVYVDLLLSGLNNAAAVFTVDVVINRSATDYQGPRWSDTKSAATDITFMRPLAFTVSVTSGDVIKVGVESSNAADTTVSGSVIFRDGLYQESVDVASISNQTAAASNLKDMLTGIGGQLELASAQDQPGLLIRSGIGNEPAMEIKNTEDQSVAFLIQNHGAQGSALRIIASDTQGQAISLSSDDGRGVTGLKVNADQISGDSVAADAIEAAFDGTGSEIYLADASTVAYRLSEIKGETANIRQDTQIDMPAQITALNDLSTADIDARLLAYDAPTKAELDAAFVDIKGATFSNATDSLEAIRNQGDAAWITGTANSLTAADVRSEMDTNSTQLAGIINKTNLITVGNIQVTSPINQAGDITIIRGDDVTLPFAYTGIEDLSTATIKFSALNKQTGVNDIDQVAGDVTGVVPAQTISVTLTNAQTKLLAVGEDLYAYDLEANNANIITTLAAGSMSVSKDITGA